MAQQAYTGLPLAVPWELAAAVLALLYGEHLTAVEVVRPAHCSAAGRIRDADHAAQG